jgi:nitrate reductase / nitrite oxidoreductase, alpha subunit
MNPPAAAGVDGPASDALLKLGKFFTRWEESDDGRVAFRRGGRSGDHRARGKGGLVRVSWAEAVEMIAAAQVHTIKDYGPDRIANLFPIPAMSMVSHCIGTRFNHVVGGAMTSFYDWYADLPVASPQVFGDRTDVPEFGDWWDATYLMMWGSNVPVTRTPDAHWMTLFGIRRKAPARA